MLVQTSNALVNFPSSGIDMAWIDLITTLLNNLRSPRSQTAYASSLRDFFAWVRSPPGAVTTGQIITYREELRTQGYSAATINRHLAAIRTLYKTAQHEGLVERSPAAPVKTLAVSQEGTTAALSREQVQAILRATDRATLQGVRDYALIVLLVRTGIRRAEAAALQLSDLEQRGKHWTARLQRKGGKIQRVKLPPDVYAALRRWIEEAELGSGALWWNLKRVGRGAAMQYMPNGVLTPNGMFRVIERCAKQAGITQHIHPHVLRATFITLALDGGAELHKVQYAAGHADPRTTERYHRTKENFEDNAVDYIKL